MGTKEQAVISEVKIDWKKQKGYCRCKLRRIPRNKGKRVELFEQAPGCPIDEMFLPGGGRIEPP